MPRPRGPRPLFGGYNAVPPPGGFRPRGPWGRFGPRGPRFGGWGGGPPHPHPQYFEDDFHEEPPFGEPPFGEPPFGEPPFGEAPFGEQPPMPPLNLHPEQIKEWLRRQHPRLIRDILFYSKWLLDKAGCPVDLSANPSAPAGPSFVKEGGDPNEPSGTGQNSFAEDDFNSGNMDGWYVPFKPIGGPNGGPNSSMQEPPSKKAKGRPHPGLGFKKNEIQWTPEGWVQKDNTHKITSTMKPLPQLDMIPPFSTTYPDAANDRDKLKMLKNNVNMMTIELDKICRRFKIKNLNREDISMYPMNQQEKLKTAIVCVGNAEKTLEDYEEFLKNDKYKDWNDQQELRKQEEIKNMIGDVPQGIPHKRPANGDDEAEDEDVGEGGQQEAENFETPAETAETA